MENSKPWAELKHAPAKRTDVLNLIRAILQKELTIPADPKMPIINLGLGKIPL
jgi:hypothetical protein